MRFHRETLEYNEITPYIYVGSNMCCGTHFQKLVKLGITADIDLQDDRDSQEQISGVETFLWLPTKDHTAPSHKQLLIGVKALQALQDKPQVLIVNLGTGNGYSVLDMIKAFEKASGKNIPYQIVDRRPGDIATCYADPAYAAEKLDWKAEYELDEMCEDTWHWQSQNPDGYPE